MNAVWGRENTTALLDRNAGSCARDRIREDARHNPGSCPDCDGNGELPIGRDYYGNWDTETCTRCQGTGDRR